MENDRNSPATSESHTSTFHAGPEGNVGGNAGMVPAMAGMHPQMPPYYNMYNWMGGMGGMGRMMPGAAGMGGMTPNMMGGGMTPAGMGGMTPNMMGRGMTPAGMDGMMPGMMQTMPGGGGGRGPQTPGENVYRPYMDLLSSDSPNSTVPETQLTGIDTFSFEELGLSPVRETPDEAGPAARGRSKGRAGAGLRARGKPRALPRE